MIKTIAVVAALCVGALAGANSSLAEGALAIGMPDGNPSKGFRHSKTVDDPNAAAEVMKDCRASRNGEVGEACRLIGTFHDQCAAVAVNGDAANSDKPIIAAGWAIAPNEATATSRAIAECETMRRGRREACQIDGKVLCDGNADDGNVCANASGDVAIAACTRAVASGQDRGDDLASLYSNRGFEYANKDDNDRAIADYNKAIEIDPKHAKAYNNRGDLHRKQGDLAFAIDDYSRAIDLEPKNYGFLVDRGNAYLAKGENDHAISDYNKAIEIDPKRSQAYFNRGRTNLYLGAIPKSLADFNQASELNPKDAYTALWLEIVNKRSNLASRLSEATSQVDMTKWPAPIIRLYLGQLTPEAALAAADDPNPKTRREQVCEANFYSGELLLQQSKRDDAAKLFKLAVADCPKGFIEYEGASAEIKTLGQTRSWRELILGR